jgi:diguanylate cyclase (GGDEF)-like protein
MHIDEPTLMIVLGIASCTASAMFFTLSVSARHIEGVLDWALGSLLVGFAVLLDGPRVIADWQWASMLFNIPLSVGQVLFLTGTSAFVGQPVRLRSRVLLITGVLILTTFFTFIVPNSVVRIVSLSTYQASINLWTAALLWKHGKTQSSRAYVSASVVTTVQGLSSLIQALLVGTSSVAITYAAPQLPIANLIDWLGTMSNILLGNWILFLLVMLRLVEELKSRANNDALTGLPNRRGLRSHIDAISAPTRNLRMLAVLLIDIDHFKRINDEHGHDTGDKVLAIMGEVMRDLSSTSAMPCRWGGEEFCFVVDRFTDDTLTGLAEATRQGFNRVTRTLPNLPDGATVSIGIAAAAVGPGFEFSKLVSFADRELYLAKNSGRNRICSWVAPVETKRATV